MVDLTSSVNLLWHLRMQFCLHPGFISFFLINFPRLFVNSCPKFFCLFKVLSLQFNSLRVLFLPGSVFFGYFLFLFVRFFSCSGLRFSSTHFSTFIGRLLELVPGRATASRNSGSFSSLLFAESKEVLLPKKESITL